MKRAAILIVFVFAVMTLVAGCAKQPTAEMEQTKAAVSDVIAAGIGKYAPEDEKMLNDALAAAMDEIKAQDAKTFKSYDKAKQMLADVKKQAETLKTDLPAKKEAAKQNAIAAQEAANAALAEAQALLAKAPKGKGTAADIDAIRGDVKGIEDAMKEVQTLIDTEEYGAAATKANAAKDQATAIKDEITQALEKVKGAKK